MASHSKTEMSGWLNKWANYWKGYQKRWFVLQNGFLSYHRNQDEMGHTCRGTINLVHAKIDSTDALTFIVRDSTSRTYHLKAISESERNQWVATLTQAKANILKAAQAVAEEDGRLQQTLPGTEEDFLEAISYKISELETCERMVSRQGEELLRMIYKTENKLLTNESNSMPTVSSSALASTESADNDNLREKITMFKVTVNAMMSGMKSFAEFSTGNVRRCQRLLVYERNQRARMERMVEELAIQHSALERKVKSQSDANRHSHYQQAVLDDSGVLTADFNGDKSAKTVHTASTGDEEEDDFFDAVDSPITSDTFSVLLPTSRERSLSNQHNLVNQEEESSSCYSASSEEDDTDSQPDVLSADKTTPSAESEMETSGRKIVRVTTRTNPASSSQSNRAVSKSVSSKSSRRGNQLSGKRQNSHTSLNGVSGAVVKLRRVRRTSILPRPNYSINMWSIMKNCIGKELSKIPMPVNFNEPLSMLQRLTEDFEYSHCLDLAAKCEDSIEQMAYVAAFSVSSYSTTLTRTGKPFNPLLGETFECDRRDDLGWRSIAEQVSHHPPAAAIHCESDTWRSWQEFTMSSKFRGKYLSIIPLGIAHLVFDASKNHYTWRKVTSTVHNIIVGRLWIDNHGEMDIFNHTTGETCHLSYKSYSYFSRDEPRRVVGFIYDKDKTPKYMLKGTWDLRIEGARITKIRNNDWETGPWTTLWAKVPGPPNAEKMYNFTLLAMQLNEMEENLAPTDSRLRPDQRLMEDGLWDDANKEKERLEEKQRAKRRKEEAAHKSQDPTSAQGHDATWFTPIHDEQANKPVYTYNGKYWPAKDQQDWSACPEIY